MKNKQASIDHDAHETKLVRRDMNLVIVLNLALLAILLGAYFLNRANGTIDRLFSGIANF